VFPSIVKDFIEAYIDSVETLQVVLFLRREFERKWHAPDVSRELAHDEAETLSRLESLALSGLVRVDRLASTVLYQSHSGDPAIQKALTELENAYHGNPDQVTLLISSRAASCLNPHRDSLTRNHRVLDVALLRSSLRS
jgi:hypothetical protein